MASHRAGESRNGGTRHAWPRTVACVGAAALLIVTLVSAAPRSIRATARSADTGPVAQAVMRALVSIPMSEAAVVGTGTARGIPAAIAGPILRGPRGLPRIVYVGAEFCPYCAAERWPLAVALSRVGRFSALRLSTSAADDVYPSTPTVTFHGAAYQSAYVEFTAVETRTNVKVNGRYPLLETPTPDVVQVFNRYNTVPYVPTASVGAIPFLDVANRFVFSGAGFTPGLLRGQSWTTIAECLSQPRTDDARAIIGAANVLTAAMCRTTGNRPSAVCGVRAIQQIEHRLVAATP